MDVEWDSKKASSNLKKHGVGFDEDVSALLDPMAMAQEDSDSEQEQRWVFIGVSARRRLLTVVYSCLHIARWGANPPHLGTQSHA
jgi:uncharacterized DUF497 family protein